MSEEDYRVVNRLQWDERAPAHAASPDYEVERFVADPSFLSGVVRFDRDRLGDLRGLRGVHLQCHLGTDTLSLERLGAQMTGLDFSAASLRQARVLADRCDARTTYVEADVLEATSVLPAHAFDLVYTGIGALCWLPSITRWARVVADLLAPGGRLFLREGHPVLWALGEPREDGVLALEHSYVERAAPLVWDEDGTYVETDVSFTHTRSLEWNHGLGEIVTALLEQGLRLTSLVEHDSVPWEALPGQMEPVGGGEMRLSDRPERLPHSYTLTAVAPG